MIFIFSKIILPDLTYDIYRVFNISCFYSFINIIHILSSFYLLLNFYNIIYLCDNDNNNKLFIKEPIISMPS